MGIEFDLHTDDYLKIIKDFEVLSSTDAIKKSLLFRYEKYKPQNDDFLQNMLENLERYHPVLAKHQPYSEEEFKEFEKRGLFPEFPPEIKKAQLLYLNHLIIRLMENVEDKKISIADINGAQKLKITEPINKIFHSKTFSVSINDASLKELHKWLITNQYIAEILFDNFSKVFNARNKADVKANKIIWLRRYRASRNHLISLFTMLLYLCPRDFHELSGVSFYKKISDCFLGHNRLELSIYSLKHSFTKWFDENKELHELIHDETTETLFEFLQSLQ